MDFWTRLERVDPTLSGPANDRGAQPAGGTSTAFTCMVSRVAYLMPGILQLCCYKSHARLMWRDLLPGSRL